MNPTSSFPRAGLAPDDHQRLRTLLVDQAQPGRARRPTPRGAVARGVVARRRRVPRVLALPAVALLVAAVVLTAAFLVPRADRSAPALPRPTPTTAAGIPADCRDSGDPPVRPSAAQKAQVDWRAPAPAGWHLDVSTIGLASWCSVGETPLAAFVRHRAAGSATVTAAVTVTRLADDPRKIAQWPNVKAHDDPPSPPSRQTVTVRGGPGTLTDGRSLTWHEPGGGWWRVEQSGLDAATLVSVADDLTLGTTVAWSGAPAAGFGAVTIPRVERRSRTRAPFKQLDYARTGCSGCTVSVVLSRDEPPAWPARLTDFRMPVSLVVVNGRPGLLATHGTWDDGDQPVAERPTELLTDLGRRVQLDVTSYGRSRPDPVALAEHLTHR